MKCTLSKGACAKLQERFLLIQSGMQDERDDLFVSIDDLNSYCDDIRQTLTVEIDDANAMFSEAMTKLAKATEAISDADKVATETTAKNKELDGRLREEMKKCNDKYISFEGEICALKKIR